MAIIDFIKSYLKDRAMKIQELPQKSLTPPPSKPL